MRSLFGAFFGLLLGTIVSALIKNDHLFNTLKEISKEPEYLTLSIAFVIFGWVAGMSSWRIRSKELSPKTADNTGNILSYDITAGEVIFLIFVLVGFIMILPKNFTLAFIYLIFHEVAWVFWLFNKYTWLMKKNSNEKKEKEKE